MLWSRILRHPEIGGLVRLLYYTQQLFNMAKWKKHDTVSTNFYGTSIEQARKHAKAVNRSFNNSEKKATLKSVKKLHSGKSGPFKNTYKITVQLWKK